MKKWSIRALVALSVVGCARNRAAEDDSARLVYAPDETKVEVMVLENGTFRRQLIANGKASAERRAELHFRTDGIIVRVNVQNGSRVAAGAEIAALDPSDKDLALRTAQLDLDRAELELQNVLAGQGYPVGDTAGVPAAVMKMARMRSGWLAADNALTRARMDRENVSLRAPFSGKVANVNLQAWDRPGGEAFCTLIDDSRMVVEFAILESEYGFVEQGQRVKVSPFPQPDEVLEGVIASVNPIVDRNGQVTVRATVANGRGVLVDGMNVRVTVERDAGSQLVVPRSAVVIRDNQEVLFRYRGGKAVWTYVHTLMSNGDSFAVEANADRGATLSPGDTVIISGNLNLADGSSIVIRK